MDQFKESLLLLLVLLNPFILSVYLIHLVREMEFRILAQHIVRAAVISMFVFWAFAFLGDAIFEDVLQLRFASFLIFGGITFLLIGIRLILGTGPAVQGLQPSSGSISGAIAMPLIIGPGTISASVLAGSSLSKLSAAAAIALALVIMTIAILLFKALHDYVRERNEPLIQKYMEIAGRATALFVGSFAIEMIMTGLQTWAGIIGLVK
jgi:multiple antibiotic resistance protein